jgi:hypothetical protein
VTPAAAVLGRTMKALHRGAALACGLLVVSSAQADEHSIIGQPGEHPHYLFEAEPHAILGFGGPFDNDGGAAVGLGFRGTVHIAQGFVGSINDTVGVGFGFDFAPGTIGRVLVPVVLQWNFWLSTHWSVFGEPGIAFGSGPEASSAYPVLSLGGRYACSERVALTMRVGYPDFAIGVSFFL